MDDCKCFQGTISAIKSISVYSVEIRDSDHELKIQTEINDLEKSMLLELPNPEYQDLQNNYQDLKNIKINDHDKKFKLPVRVILGLNNYTRIKTQERSRMGTFRGANSRTNKTRLGCFIA